jgi:hypothetical protein
MRSGSPGTADLYEVLQEYRERQRSADRQMRTILLSLVDQIERRQGYGQPGCMPRTATMRQFWAAEGRPALNDSGHREGG